MKKSSSDFIFRLIKSLTKSEKRYFKIYSNRFTYKDKQKYLDLFDAIDKQKKYDEVALKKKFEGEKFLKHFPTVKTRLKDMVLESLYEMNEKSSEEQQYRNQIAYTRILFEKNLISEGHRLLLKLKKQLMARNLNELYISILQEELQYMLYANTANVEAIKHWEAEISNTAQRIANKNQIHGLFLYLLELQRKNHFADTLEVKEQIVEIFKMLKTFREKVQTTHSKLYLYESFAIGHFMLRDYLKAKTYMKKRLELHRSDKAYFKKYTDAYITHSYNYTIICLQLSDFEEIERVIKNWREIEQNRLIKKQNTLNRLFYYQYATKLNIAKENNIPQGIDIANELKPIIPFYKDKLAKNELIVLLYEMTLFFLINQQYDKALKQAEDLFALKIDKTKMPRRIINTYWLEIIIHFELKNNLLLENLLTNYQRFLKKYNHYNEATNLLFSNLKKVLNTIHVSDKQKTWERTLLGLNTIEPNQRFRFVPSIIQDWLDSKIQNRPLKEILMEKHEREKTN